MDLCVHVTARRRFLGALAGTSGLTLLGMVGCGGSGGETTAAEKVVEDRKKRLEDPEKKGAFAKKKK
jgi:hypothetical protein